MILRNTSILIALLTLSTSTLAQNAPENAPEISAVASAGHSWQQCAALTAPESRLACFDRWAAAQTVIAPVLESKVPVAPVNTTLFAPKTEASIALQDDTENTRADGCQNRQFSALSRLWELERGAGCDTFGIRGYRPISLSWILSDGVNTAPSSPTPEHTASYQAYQRYENRIQLSVRTKIAQGLFTPTSADPHSPHDSLWFGYTQQSYWQLFNGALSRPFRATDHEPELMYVYPSTAKLPGGWQLRYSGVGLVHQSNGQSLPLSRSWNRVYLMAGAEKGTNYRVMGRIWQRLPEKTNDDNPDIADRIGRAELQGVWDMDQRNTLSATFRNSLAARANGSVRLEWLRTLGDPRTSGLRFHTQLFNGYGDSLVDYNRRRIVLSLGLSLVDF